MALSPVRKRDLAEMSRRLREAHPSVRFETAGPTSLYATLYHATGLRAAVSVSPGLFVVQWRIDTGSLSTAFAADVGPVNRLTRRSASSRCDGLDGLLDRIAVAWALAASGEAYEHDRPRGQHEQAGRLRHVDGSAPHVDR